MIVVVVCLGSAVRGFVLLAKFFFLVSLIGMHWTHEQEYWEKEPPPLRSEVARAIRQTASRKATGPDDVPAELFKAGGETALDRMPLCILSNAVSPPALNSSARTSSGHVALRLAV